MRRSCQEYKESGSVSNGEYLIDPDGPETRTLVNGYDAPSSYSRDISYNISMAQIIALLNLSHNCEQFIKYECRGSVILLYDNLLYASWVSRDGVKMKYWGGASPGSGKCACGMTKTCHSPGRFCNCHSNDNVWRFDEGYLTDRNVLPVSKLYFGDTGAGEAGYNTLGNLTCYGKK